MLSAAVFSSIVLWSYSTMEVEWHTIAACNYSLMQVMLHVTQCGCQALSKRIMLHYQGHQV